MDIAACDRVCLVVNPEPGTVGRVIVPGHPINRSQGYGRPGANQVSTSVLLVAGAAEIAAVEMVANGIVGEGAGGPRTWNICHNSQRCRIKNGYFTPARGGVNINPVEAHISEEPFI